MGDMREFFGDVISEYSRAQAIEDGVLVDVSETAREAGLRYPLALTRAVWESCVTVPVNGKGQPVPCQDERGRLWDVVSMTRFAIRLSPAGHDTLPVRLRVRQRAGHRLVTLKAVCGPGDDAEPVITIMLPEED